MSGHLLLKYNNPIKHVLSNSVVIPQLLTRRAKPGSRGMARSKPSAPEALDGHYQSTANELQKWPFIGYLAGGRVLYMHYAPWPSPERIPS